MAAGPRNVGRSVKNIRAKADTISVEDARKRRMARKKAVLLVQVKRQNPRIALHARFLGEERVSEDEWKTPTDPSARAFDK
jgi:hypothetical protein